MRTRFVRGITIILMLILTVSAFAQRGGKRKVSEATVPMEPEIANVPDAVIRAVNEAQDLLRIVAGDDVTRADGTTTQATVGEVKDNARKAAALLEGAFSQIPSERKAIRAQVQQVLAQAQYQAGDFAKAIDTLQELVAADPSNSAYALLLVNSYLEADRLPEGKSLLEKLPADAIADPNVYINVGILFLNKDNHADAVQYLDKAIALDATSVAAYYYRGLAHLRLEKSAEAKGDLEKVIALAPDGPEANEARQLLASLPN